MREVSGAPIKFVGTGEGMDALEPFYPERMANRILGMGDMLTLFEKAQEAINETEVEEFQKRLAAAKFDFNDFMAQFERINNMGGLKMLKLMPGFNQVSEKQLYEVERKFKMYSALIASMTKEEREAPELLIKSPSRRRRVAEGAGRKEADVSQLCTEFAAMRVQMQTMSKMMKLGAEGADGGLRMWALGERGMGGGGKMKAGGQESDSCSPRQLILSPPSHQHKPPPRR